MIRNQGSADWGWNHSGFPRSSRSPDPNLHSTAGVHSESLRTHLRSWATLLPVRSTV